MNEEVQEIEDTEGVDETTLETSEKPSLARDSIIDGIYKKRREERDSELTGEAEEEAEEEAVDELVNLKVDGEIIQKLSSEVEAEGGLATYQKTLAADKRFKEAAITKQQNDQHYAEIQRKEKALLDREQAIKAHKPLEVSDEDVNSFIDNVYSGDEAKAKEAFRTVLSRIKSEPPAPTEKIDEAAIVEKAMYQIDRQNGVEKFATDYDHLNNDSKLRDMVDQATIRILKENPKMSPSKIINQAAIEVDTWLNQSTGKTDLVDDANEKKAKIKTVKKANVRMKAPTGYKPKTQAEIFAGYKATRPK